VKPTVTYPCGNCSQGLERPLDGSAPAACPQCHTEQAFHPEAIVHGAVTRCPICGLKVLFTQKDFRQAIGCVVVLIAAVLAPFTMYLSLVAAAIIDFVLYQIAGTVVICYSMTCRSHVRGVPAGASVQPFDLSIHDYYRSVARKAAAGEQPEDPEDESAEI